MEHLSLEAALTKAGIEITPDFSIEKQRSGAQYLFCNVAEIAGKAVHFATYGDFSRGIEESWKGEHNLTDAEKAAFKDFLKKKKSETAEIQTQLWEDAKAHTAKFLAEECTERSQLPPYLVKKGISKLHGAKVHVNAYGSLILVVPLRDIDGVIWSYQRIFPEKLSAGDKFLLENGRKQGCFFLFGEFDPKGKIYVAEGFATAASIYEAFNQSATVVASIDSGNLDAVGRELRRRFPDVGIIFCADNDCYSSRGPSHNAGVDSATRAAANCGGEIRVPRFTDTTSNPTDWNDLHTIAGLDAVHEQIKHPENYRDPNSVEPIVCKGKPSEEAIAFQLLRVFQDKLIREENDLFVYTGTHWELVETKETIAVRNLIRSTSPGKLTSRDVDSAFKTFKDKLEHVPHGVSLFTPSPAMANFKNGTVHFLKNSDGSFRAELRPHNRSDFVTSCLPFDFLPEDTTVNEEFEAMLDRIWKSDKDQAHKILRYGEDLGAMFCGLFPSISIYQGKPGTGKSTLLQLASKLIAEENLCMVDPTQFEGFSMESMPGKLVNIVTDLDTSRYMSDALVKMITDRVKFRIRRKGLKDIYAYIPAIHLWACNTLPKSFEGATGAMGRRVTIIKTEQFQPVGLYNKEYHLYVWDHCPQGIINFAVRGLLRLLQNKGHYTVPESARDAMDGWREESDVVGVFLTEIKEGLISDGNRAVFRDEKAKIERKSLWKLFCTWHKEDRANAPKITKIKFFDQVISRGFEISTIHGVRMFSGIGVDLDKTAQH